MGFNGLVLWELPRPLTERSERDVSVFTEALNEIVKIDPYEFFISLFTAKIPPLWQEPTTALLPSPR